MDFGKLSNTLFFMAKTVHRKLYLSEWMARLGVRPVDLARGAGISESYISTLRAGKLKKNPTPDVLLAISDALRITVNEMYSPPPNPAAVAAIRELQPDTVQRLIAAGRKQIHKTPKT